MATGQEDHHERATERHVDDVDAPPPKILYGYVRVVRGDDKRATLLKADLLAFCQAYGYMRGTVFVDWGVEDTAIARPSFTSLLDVCRLVGAHGVVVPARAHLSSHAETLALLQLQIQRTGVELVVADEFEANLHRAIAVVERPLDTVREPSS
jgi:hypothetical protein